MSTNSTDLKQMALEEYGSDTYTAHHGYVAGGLFWSGQPPVHDNVKSRPFWNTFSSQFIFAPCFEFAPVPGCVRYRFTATDCCKTTHTFEAQSPMATLSPIWCEIPEGQVELKVEALDIEGNPWTLVGARAFWKGAPFTGDYPPKARSYREAARMAYRYIYNMPAIQHWLTYGTPDPTYDLNVYPSKMIASIIHAMIAYSSLDMENTENALRLARNAADYLLSITIEGDSPLAGLPPTYYTSFRENTENTYNAVADQLDDTVMMIYPAEVGLAYLALGEATGDTKYLDAARRIAGYYQQNVLENGTWPLVVAIADGENRSPNNCTPEKIISFLNKMHACTGEAVWKELEENAFQYLVKTCLEKYDWEGQFEDSPTSAHYSNMTHFTADFLIRYIAENKKDNRKAMAEAEDMMRFVEDQFVVWGKHAYHDRWLNQHWSAEEKEQWISPAALEQYNWYVPIDSSAACIIESFMGLYKANGNPLLLAKARALADSCTRMQNPDTGMIPTHWFSEQVRENGGQFWINCHIHTAGVLFMMADETEDNYTGFIG